MADEIGGLNLEEGGGVRQDVNKVTEEAVRRVQDDSKKAQQVGQEIKKDKTTNNQLAKFLGFLLKNIKDEDIIKGLYNVFFKSKHPKSDITFLRKNVNIVVIVGMFAPFYVTEIAQDGLDQFFDGIYDFSSPVSLSKYVEYIKKLSAKYHDNVPINKHSFLDFLMEIVKYYELVNTARLTLQSNNELKQSLSKELYGHSLD